MPTPSDLIFTQASLHAERHARRGRALQAQLVRGMVRRCAALVLAALSRLEESIADRTRAARR